MLRDRIIIHEFHEDTDNYEPDYMFTPEQVEEEMRIRDQERVFERLGKIIKPDAQLQKTLDELAGVISNPK